MRFIHISDIHIGAKPDSNMPWSEARGREIHETFYGILNLCEEQQIDLLLIAGDIFHKQPLLRDLKELNYYFGKLTRTQVVMIAGNHDYIGPKSNYIGFPWESNVHMLQGSEIESIYLEELNTEVYGFSYHMRNIKEAPAIDFGRLKENRTNILLYHGGEEKYAPINLNELKTSDFDYIALGHIHKPQLFHGKMAYAGSLEPLDKNELGERGYVQGEITSFGLSYEFVPFSKRIYQQLEIVIKPDMTNGAIYDSIREKIQEAGEDNIYRIQLVGYRDIDLSVSIDEIKELGNIIEVINDTVPDFDFVTLSEENKDNIIGLYIDKIHESNTANDIKLKALYYGLEALLHCKMS